jgi:hypothetical protein
MNATAGFAAWLRRAVDAAELTFCKMARIHFEAPWREEGSSRC